MVLLHAGALHPVCHLEEQASTFGKGALLAHDALAQRVGHSRRHIGSWILSTVQTRA